MLTREPYGYVGGDPLNSTDPLGLWPSWNTVKKVATGAGLVLAGAAAIAVTGGAATPLVVGLGVASLAASGISTYAELKDGGGADQDFWYSLAVFGVNAVTFGGGTLAKTAIRQGLWALAGYLDSVAPYFNPDDTNPGRSLATAGAC